MCHGSVKACFMPKDDIDLSNPAHVKFSELLKACRKYFGEPRIVGSHHIFKTPWQGDPRINIQSKGKMAKPYQVKQVKKAIDKIKELLDGSTI